MSLQPQRGGELRVHETEDAAVVRFPGSNLMLDETRIHHFRDQLLHLAEAAAGRSLVLDFANVAFVSGGTLGVLVTLYKRLKDRGANLVLCGLRPSLAEVFQVTRLDELLELRDEAPSEPVAVA